MSGWEAGKHGQMSLPNVVFKFTLEQGPISALNFKAIVLYYDNFHLVRFYFFHQQFYLTLVGHKL